MKGSLMLEVSGTIPEGTDYICSKNSEKNFFITTTFSHRTSCFWFLFSLLLLCLNESFVFCLNKRCLSLQSFDQSKILGFVWSDFSFWKKRKENFREFNPLWSIKRLIFYSKKPKKFLRIRFYILSLNNDPKMEKNTNLYKKCKVH